MNIKYAMSGNTHNITLNLNGKDYTFSVTEGNEPMQKSSTPIHDKYIAMKKVLQDEGIINAKGLPIKKKNKKKVYLSQNEIACHLQAIMTHGKSVTLKYICTSLNVSKSVITRFMRQTPNIIKSNGESKKNRTYSLA
jgi:hypothetical protein